MKKIVADTLTLFLLIFSFAAVGMLLRTNDIWGEVTFAQIITNVHGGISLVSDDLKNSYILYAGLGILAALVAFFSFNKNKYPLILSFCAIFFVLIKTESLSYFLNRHIYSDLYEKEYVDPKDISFTFENGKRNLIVIYLESMEKNYMNVGKDNKNLLPNISRLMDSSLSFENFYQLSGQGYTLAAMVGSMCAVPYNERVFIGGHDAYRNFLNELVCYPEILKRYGYQTFFLKGADIDFARSGLFLETHGFEKSIGRDELEKLGYTFSENVGTFDGFNDRMTYQIAQEKLTELAAQNKPFLFSFLTLDTHDPDPFLEPFCKKTDNGFGDIVLCADQMLADFLSWLEKQDFYDNTTIVVLGDHIKSGRQHLEIQDENIEIVNFIIHSQKKALKVPHKKWTTLDVAPTVLNATGISFKDGKFGLGRSLFFDSPTLFEIMGHKLETELQKNSKVYENFEKLSVQTLPTYKLWTYEDAQLTDAEQIASYSTFSNIFLNATFLDELSFSLPRLPQNGVKISISFQKILQVLTPPTIEVFVNHQLMDKWTVLPKDKQPLHKVITVPISLIGEDGRLLIQFKDSKEVPVYEIFGIGVHSIKLEMF